MKNHIRFQFDDDGDGTGALQVEFHADGFAGRGHGYFDTERLIRQLDAFSAYPLSAGNPPEITSGFLNSLGEMEDEHFHFSVFPVDATGHLVASIRVVSPYSVASDTLRHSASVKLRTTYAGIERLVADMQAMLRGELSEVLLEADG
ncbi:hypothetical protein PI87_14325 [Ralstonia sp. A12]|uniref:hypothetical protein n=1 Tax=Ralstonia sp. A12 TaxID=1217052 RepID=UPI0005751BC9|nr:hypothetical protein [Ralstonia sp. A12]KHK54778.1 hypothetical protein PI87_14325 [Ralstonia sp. A12]